MIEEILRELPSIEAVVENSVRIGSVAVMVGFAYLTSQYHPRRKDTEETVTVYSKPDY